MTIVLFGYGKMGKYIYRGLTKHINASHIYVVDPIFPEKSAATNQFRRFEEIPPNIRFDAAFIATHSTTHCDVLKQVISHGILNIFCEKPMCLTQKEYCQIQKILPKQAHLIVDYILRSSPTIPIWNRVISQARQTGYHIHKCDIHYCKDTRQDPRRFHDLGLYEDMYHVWDLCLNGPLFQDLSAIQILKSLHFFSSEIKNRCVEQHLLCRLKPQKGSSFHLKITASFQADQLDRSFACILKKGKEKTEVKLIFDQEGTDKCIVKLPDQTIQEYSFPSHDKLDTMIRDSLIYFKTGQKPAYAHTLTDSVCLHRYLHRLRQAPPFRRK